MKKIFLVFMGLICFTSILKANILPPKGKAPSLLSGGCSRKLGEVAMNRSFPKLEACLLQKGLKNPNLAKAIAETEHFCIKEDKQYVPNWDQIGGSPSKNDKFRLNNFCKKLNNYMMARRADKKAKVAERKLKATAKARKKAMHEDADEGVAEEELAADEEGEAEEE